MNEISAHPASEENVGFLLWQVSTLWSNSTSTALKPLGLTHPQFILLAAIDWLKEVSPEKLARHIVLDLKVTSHLLRSLQVKGLIEKSTYQLTISGREMLAKALSVVESADIAFFASVDLKNSKMVDTLQTLAHARLSEN